jgi:hypothetical protein
LFKVPEVSFDSVTRETKHDGFLLRFLAWRENSKILLTETRFFALLSFYRGCFFRAIETIAPV